MNTKIINQIKSNIGSQENLSLDGILSLVLYLFSESQEYSSLTETDIINIITDSFVVGK